ncbi:unnamed protein product, partial [Protopolystoma xenopodis]
MFHTLFKAKKMTDIPVILLTERNSSLLLDEGDNLILTNSGLEAGYCGLVPLEGPCKATTSGLKWNL